MDVTSGYMAWFFCDDDAERPRLKARLNGLSDGTVPARGLYLYEAEKITDLERLRAEYADRADIGITIVVYEVV